MGKRVEPAQRPMSRAGSAEAASAEDGFTLIEVVCVLAIITIIAAIILPAIPRGTPRARIEGYAIEAASLLKADRNMAMRRGIAIATEVDPIARYLRSGATGRSVRIPDDVQFAATLATRCNGRAAGHAIEFFASGMSCGGTLALTRQGVGYQIRVYWLTGGIEVAKIETL